MDGLVFVRALFFFPRILSKFPRFNSEVWAVLLVETSVLRTGTQGFVERSPLWHPWNDGVKPQGA